MTKQEFLSELESLLLDIPKEERDEALKYYEDYFEDAGVGMEQSIIREIGIPKKVAATIKSDLYGNLDRNRGEFTETGYKDFAFEHKDEIFNSNSDGYEKNKEEQSNSSQRDPNSTFYQKENGKRDSSKFLMIILICILGFPFITAAISVIFGLLMAVASIFFAFMVVSVVFLVIGIVLMIVGIMQLFVLPSFGAIILGTGFILTGFGFLFLTFSIWICSKVLPSLFRGVIELCRKPFHKRSVTV